MKPEAQETTPAAPHRLGVRAINEHVLQVTLQRPDHSFPALVAHPVFRPVKVADADRTNRLESQDLISNGAFLLTATENDSVRLERARTYWDGASVALEKVTFVNTASAEDALTAYEALLHTGTAPSDIVFAGESAGGGLAIATLVNARDHGLPLPAAAFVMSPYAYLTLAGATLHTKREVDVLMSPENLQNRVTDYTGDQDAASGLISPVFADLSGLPPLIIQVGTHEVLLDDAVRLARQAATADVAVTLDITPGVPHVFQAYSPILDEAAAALDRAGQLLLAHLASAERVTA